MFTQRCTNVTARWDCVKLSEKVFRKWVRRRIRSLGRLSLHSHYSNISFRWLSNTSFFFSRISLPPDVPRALMKCGLLAIPHLPQTCRGRLSAVSTLIMTRKHVLFSLSNVHSLVLSFVSSVILFSLSLFKTNNVT